MAFGYFSGVIYIVFILIYYTFYMRRECTRLQCELHNGTLHGAKMLFLAWQREKKGHFSMLLDEVDSYFKRVNGKHNRSHSACWLRVAETLYVASFTVAQHHCNNAAMMVKAHSNICQFQYSQQNKGKKCAVASGKRAIFSELKMKTKSPYHK